MYKDENPQSPVKQSYFRHIFNREFNLGFGTPTTDVCSTCIELNERIKKEADQVKKNELMTALRVHKLRAKAFFKMLQEQKDDMITFSFDCQKNSPLPRIPDQSAYYSRQFYLYNFTIVQGSSKDKLKAMVRPATVNEKQVTSRTINYQREASVVSIVLSPGYNGYKRVCKCDERLLVPLAQSCANLRTRHTCLQTTLVASSKTLWRSFLLNVCDNILVYGTQN